MTRATRREVDELLRRHGFAPIAETEAESGGRRATVWIGYVDGAERMTVTIGGASVSGKCPLDQRQATELLANFRGREMPAGDPKFWHMVAHLLVKATLLFRDCGGDTLRFEDLHLYPSSYRIGGVELETVAPLHVVTRLAPDAHDRHARFNFRHGSDVRFPK